MKKIFYVIMFFLLVISISCTRNKKDEKSSPKIVMKISPKSLNSIPLSDIFSGIKIINLNTGTKGLIGRISKVIQSNKGNDFIVSNRTSLKIFDSTGNLKFELKDGAGPGRFNYIGSFSASYYDTVFSFVDFYKQKLLVYNYKGNLLNTCQLDLFAENIFPIRYPIYAIDVEQPCKRTSSHLNFFNLSTNKIVGQFFPIQSKYLRFLSFHVDNFFQWHDSVYFVNIPFDTIYNISSDAPKPEIIADFGKYKLEKNDLDHSFKDVMEFIQFSQKNNLAFNIEHFFALKNNLFFSYSFAGRIYPAIYNTREKKVKSLYKFIDDVAIKGHNVRLFNYFFPVGKVRDGLVFSVDPLKLKEEVDSIVKPMSHSELTKFKKNNPVVYNTYKNVTPKTNTLLVIYKLKK